MNGKFMWHVNKLFCLTEQAMCSSLWIQLNSDDLQIQYQNKARWSGISKTKCILAKGFIEEIQTARTMKTFAYVYRNFAALMIFVWAYNSQFSQKSVLINIPFLETFICAETEQLLLILQTSQNTNCKKKKKHIYILLMQKSCRVRDNKPGEDLHWAIKRGKAHCFV